MPELKDIISIAGQPGLYQIIGKRPNGLIVESIDAQKRRFPTSLSQKVSVLEDISVYTHDGDVKLMNIFISIQDLENNGAALVSKKDAPDKVREFFKQVLPDYDAERVYVSDMAKIIHWYSILKGVLSFEIKPESDAVAAEETNTESESVPEKKVTKSKPAAKSKKADKSE